ncbi:MAG: potassium-transporting ATPase subunit KdpA [Nostoc sp.]
MEALAFISCLKSCIIAYFEIIKQSGEYGGGFFAINSAHPFENPSEFTNIIQIVVMLSIPTPFPAWLVRCSHLSAK